MANSDDREAQSTMQNLMSEVEALLATLGEQGSQRYREATVDLQRRMRRARDQFDDAHYATSRQARLAARRADHYVQENPWATAGAAAALGAAVGALVAVLVMQSWNSDD
jgi:ElaB/YqjD/DUF883 family membrane-anchored ribosome-binding protein